MEVSVRTQIRSFDIAVDVAAQEVKRRWGRRVVKQVDDDQNADDGR